MPLRNGLQRGLRSNLRRTIRRFHHLRREHLRLLAIAEDQQQTIHAYTTQIENLHEERSCKICQTGVKAGWLAVPCGHAVSIY